MERQELGLRPCVGIALFNRQGLVWAGRRVRKSGSKQNFIGEEKDSLWQMPQGGIERGETPLAAAKRELWEETGIKSAEFLAEAAEWLSYQLPAEILAGKGGRPPLGGKYRGQKQKWLAFLFTGEESEIAVNPPPKADEVEFDAWAWRDLPQVAAQIVAFKRDVYARVAAEFAPLAARLKAEAQS